MSLNSTVNYKADVLYEELFRRHLVLRYDNIIDVITHHISTYNGSIIASVELYMTNGDILFRNLKVDVERNKNIVIYLESELIGYLNETM